MNQEKEILKSKDQEIGVFVKMVFQKKRRKRDGVRKIDDTPVRLSS